MINHLHDRPHVLKDGYVDGAAGKPYFKKRVPHSAPPRFETAEVTFPSGRSARELLPNNTAHLVWGVNLGVIDWNPWPSAQQDPDHPDELRVGILIPRQRPAGTRRAGGSRWWSTTRSQTMA